MEPQIRFRPADVRACLADYLAIRSGRNPSDPDPVAVELAATRNRASLGEIAAHLAGMDHDPQTVVRAFSSGDFSAAFEHALSTVAGIDFSAQTAESDPLLWRVPSRGIRPVDVPRLDVGTLQAVASGGGPVMLPLATITDAVVDKPILYAARVLVSRQLLVDDDAGVIDSMIRQLSGQAARIRTELIAGALDAATMTETSATGLDVSAVGEALAALRTAATPQGHKANLRAEFLVVPPGKESVALTLMEAMGNRLRIIVNPWITSACYLLCPPEASPVLATPVPMGSNGQPVVLGTSPIETDPVSGDQSVYDGKAFRFESYLGVTLVDATGAVRIPAA